MKLNLTKHMCVELSIAGQINLSPELGKELIRLAKAHDQWDDEGGIFFHQDYQRSKVKHHFHISLEELIPPTSNAIVEFYYSIVESGRMNKTIDSPEELISRISTETTILFQCNCELLIPRHDVVDGMLSIPLSVPFENTQHEVTFTGASLTVQSGKTRVYDLQFKAEEQDGQQVFRLVYSFEHQGNLSTDLPGAVLDKAVEFRKEISNIRS